MIFLGSILFFLLMPAGFYFLNKYSAFLHKHLTQPIEDDKIFLSNKTRFQVTFRILFLGGILLSIIYLLSALSISSGIVNNSAELSPSANYYFYFILIQIVLAFILLNFLLFSFLYYRLKPDERHPFIRKFTVITSSILFFNALFNIPYYFSVVKNQSLPILLASINPQPVQTMILEINPLLPAIMIIIVSIYCFIYLKFSRNRNNVNAKLFLILYLVTLMAIMYISLNFTAGYFDVFKSGFSKQNLFDINTGYSGVLWIYLAILSLSSILFSLYIFIKRKNFIGSQFATNYILKLAKVNLYCTLSLGIIAMVPWIFTYYFKYV